VSRSSCESKIYATNEGTKSAITVQNLLTNFGFSDGTEPTPVWNDNRGCVDWTKGVTVSKKLRHINLRELSVRLYQQNGDVDIRHIEGKKNIADLFTKEIKDAQHFHSMAFTITNPHLVKEWVQPSHGEPIVIKGGVEETACWTKVMTSCWIPSGICQSLGLIIRIPTVLFGARGLY
jgi:hypothetical protein